MRIPHSIAESRRQTLFPLDLQSCSFETSIAGAPGRGASFWARHGRLKFQTEQNCHDSNSGQRPCLCVNVLSDDNIHSTVLKLALCLPSEMNESGQSCWDQHLERTLALFEMPIIFTNFSTSPGQGLSFTVDKSVQDFITKKGSPANTFSQLVGCVVPQHSMGIQLPILLSPGAAEQTFFSQMTHQNCSLRHPPPRLTLRSVFFTCRPQGGIH